MLLSCIQMLLLVVRVMDDVKDYEKDKIVHPERSVETALMHRVTTTCRVSTMPCKESSIILIYLSGLPGFTNT